MTERITPRSSPVSPQSLPLAKPQSPATSLEGREGAEETAGSARLFDRSPSATQRTEGLPEIQPNLEDPIVPLTKSETLSSKEGFWGLLKENLKVTVGSSETPKVTRLARFARNLFGIRALFQTIRAKYKGYQKAKIATAESRRAQSAENRTNLQIIRQKIAIRRKRLTVFPNLYSSPPDMRNIINIRLRTVDSVLKPYGGGKKIKKEDEATISNHLKSVDQLLGLEPQKDLQDIYKESNYADSVKAVQQKWEERLEEYKDKIPTNDQRALLFRSSLKTVENILSKNVDGGELNKEDQGRIINVITFLDKEVGRENSDDLADLFRPTPPQDQ